jgi:hypothetical protein
VDISEVDLASLAPAAGDQALQETVVRLLGLVKTGQQFGLVGADGEPRGGKLVTRIKADGGGGRRRRGVRARRTDVDLTNAECEVDPDANLDADATVHYVCPCDFTAASGSAFPQTNDFVVVVHAQCFRPAGIAPDNNNDGDDGDDGGDGDGDDGGGGGGGLSDGEIAGIVVGGLAGVVLLGLLGQRLRGGGGLADGPLGVESDALLGKSP